MTAVGLDSQQFKRLLSRAVMLPVALALILSTVLLIEVFYLLSFYHWLEHTDRVLQQTYELERLLADQESGRRGYFLTGEERFLDRYEAAVPLIPPIIDGLLGSVTDNDTELRCIREVRDLYGQWAVYAAETIELKRNGHDVALIV